MKDIPPFYEKLIRKIKAPIMIDTTDPKAVELALTYCQGKSIINSINLEDGEEKFERICPIAKALRRGAGGGLASTKTSCRRRRSRASASWPWRSAPSSCSPRSTAFRAEDIIIDPLVFPCATGDENYIGGAVETIEGIRLIKEKIPLRQDRARDFEHLVRPARGGARSGQLGLPVLLHQGRARPGDRQRGEAGALRVDSRRGAARWPRTCCSTRRRSTPTDESLRTAPEDWREQTRRAEGRHQPVPHRRDRRAFPQGRQARQSSAPRICRSISGWPTTSSKAPRTA